MVKSIPLRLSLIFLAVATVALGCSAVPGGSGQQREEPFSGERAYQHVRYLATDVGSRPASTEKAEMAANYIADQFRSQRLQVEKPRFDYRTYMEKQVELEVTRPVSATFKARALTFSASGERAAELVDAGGGSKEDFGRIDVKDKIALIKRGEITFGGKVANAADAGAVGVIVYNNVGGELRGSLANPSTIPAVSVTLEEGQRLRALLGQGATAVRLLVDAEMAAKSSENVVGTRATKNQKLVIFGAHCDSVEAGPGANDNASGVGTVIELARVTATRAYPFGLRFVAFGAEELGLIGSRRYVESLKKEERDRMVAMINFDMVGVGDDLRFGGDRKLVDEAKAIAKDLEVEAGDLDEHLSSASDHASFADAGIPTLFVYWQEDPNYHTKNDLPEFVKPDRLEIAGKIALGMLERLAKEGEAKGENTAMDQREAALVSALPR
ncbi:MAG: M28 family peptidase [Chloroflexi bacterium]|nr:M28 family peptidase [Chloroflexota bacterium]